MTPVYNRLINLGYAVLIVGTLVYLYQTDANQWYAINKLSSCIKELQTIVTANGELE